MMVLKSVPVNEICTFMTTIGERLKEERDRLGLSQAALGAVGGVQKQAQLKYEKGERFPGADYLASAAKVGLDVQYVVMGERSSAALTADEAELLDRFRAAPLAVKAAAIAAVTAGSMSSGGSSGERSTGGGITVSGNGNRTAGGTYHEN